MSKEIRLQLAWLLAIVTAAEDVKPTITGREMKSIRKPSWRSPDTRMMTPEIKVSRTAYSGP